MENEILSLLVIIALLILVILIFIRIALYLRKRGGSLTTTMIGSTYEFLNKDKREAVEEIVELNAGKKMEEQKSGEPEKDRNEE